MRFTRLAATLAAMLTAIMVALSIGSVAEAATKPLHQVVAASSGETRTDGIFYTKGTVITGVGQRVYLQQRTRSNPSFRTVKSVRSNTTTGRFIIKFRGKCGAGYRIVVRETASRARTAIRIGRVTCS